MIKNLACRFSLKNELSFDEISPGFPVIHINNVQTSATISLYGGQLLEYEPHEVDTAGQIQLSYPGYKRKIIISKENSLSPVIWYPWQAKSSFMSDMSDQAW